MRGCAAERRRRRSWRRAKRPPARLGGGSLPSTDVSPGRQRGLGFNAADMYLVECWLTGL